MRNTTFGLTVRLLLLSLTFLQLSTEISGQPGQAEKNTISSGQTKERITILNGSIQPEFGILAGINIAKLNLSSTTYPLLDESDYKLSMSYSAGVFCNLRPANEERHWSVNNELLFTRFYFMGNTDHLESSYRYFYYSDFDYSHLKLNSMFRYCFDSEGAGIFTEAGLSVGQIILGSNSYTSIYEYPDGSYTINEGVAMTTIRKTEPGILVGAGIKFSKLQLETRFELTNGFSPYLSTDTNISRIYILLGYSFK